MDEIVLYYFTELFRLTRSLASECSDKSRITQPQAQSAQKLSVKNYMSAKIRAVVKPAF